MGLCLGQGWLRRLVISFSIVAASAAHARDLRVITYNLFRGKGIDDAPMSLKHFLTEHRHLRDFDVLGVQEICGDRGGEQVETLAALLSTPGRPVYTHFVSSDLNDKKECGKGQAIFSRHRILSAGSELLPFVRQPRMMVWVDIEVDGRPIRIYNLHLDNRGEKKFFIEKDRLRQVRGALGNILSYRKANPGAATIALGDFNSIGKIFDLWRREPAIREMDKHFDPSLKGFHMTAIPWLQLDWIFYDGLELRRSRVVRHFENSDHLPVMADFRLSITD